MNFPLEKENGIFSYLNKKSNGNIDSYVTATVSCSPFDGYPPENLFDSDKNSYWIVENRAPEGNYLTFCLKNLHVKISGYQISTPRTSHTDAWPKKWGFLGLFSPNDSNEEEVIVELETSLQSSQSLKMNYSRSVHQCFRYINHQYTDYGSGWRSRLSEIEIYGILYGFLCPTNSRTIIFRFSLFFFTFFI